MKTAAIAVLGGLLTLAGIALLVLPGPGFVLVAAGLAVPAGIRETVEATARARTHPGGHR